MRFREALHPSLGGHLTEIGSFLEESISVMRLGILLVGSVAKNCEGEKEENGIESCPWP